MTLGLDKPELIKGLKAHYDNAYLLRRYHDEDCTDSFFARKKSIPDAVHFIAKSVNTGRLPVGCLNDEKTGEAYGFSVDLSKVSKESRLPKRHPTVVILEHGGGNVLNYLFAEPHRAEEAAEKLAARFGVCGLSFNFPLPGVLTTKMDDVDCTERWSLDQWCQGDVVAPRVDGGDQ